MNYKIYQYNTQCDEKYNAVKKAGNDVYTIWKDMGMYDTLSKHRSHLFDSIERMVKVVSANILFIQYPAYNERLIQLITKLNKKNKIVAFIHDLESLRTKVLSEEAEYQRLNNVDALIVLTEEMKNWFVNKGFSKPIVVLEMWDFLAENRMTLNNNRNIIDYAGNLQKSNFINQLYKLNSLKFNLYGKGNLEIMNNLGNNVIYKGAFLSEQLPTVMNGGWGLVWDGPNIEECSGNYGQYLKYNIPHKSALYLACGKPVITWKHSAIAQYICKHRVGLVVNSLFEVATILNKINSDKYKEICDNVSEVQKKICSGYHIHRATKAVIKLLDEN